MSRHYVVSLPVKPHIRKFIATIEGEQIFWDNRSPLCLVMRAFMSNSRSLLYSHEKYEQAAGCRRDELKIHVPVLQKASVGTNVHPAAIVLINQMLEDCFENTFLAFVRENTVAEGRYRGFKAAIEAFAKAYNIDLDEDISFDGLQKMEIRARKKEKKITTLVLSLYTPRLACVS